MLPSCFISHGPPDRVLHPSLARDFLLGFPKLIEKPKGIFVVSAHWETEGLHLSRAGELDTIHDFYGFAPELYRQKYPAKQTEALSQLVAEKLGKQNISFAWKTRGLDHGAWSVLALAYPDTDIPVISMSLPNYQDAHEYIELGKSISALRDQDILIMGSGSATHNLRELSMQNRVPEWAKEFISWLQEKVEQNDYDSLVNLYKAAPHARRAHPTFEHYAPLLVAMGAAYQQPSKLIHDSTELGSLNNSSWLFG